MREGLTETTQKVGRTRFISDPIATGAHTVFRRDALTNIRHYETYRLQTNPRNPNPWESLKRDMMVQDVTNIGIKF